MCVLDSPVYTFKQYTCVHMIIDVELNNLGYMIKKLYWAVLFL